MNIRSSNYRRWLRHWNHMSRTAAFSTEIRYTNLAWQRLLVYNDDCIMTTDNTVMILLNTPCEK